MGDRSKIEWTDATWNPTVGCSLVSPGCTNCYAMKLAGRLERMGAARYAGLTTHSKAGPVWTGEVRAAPLATLLQPFNWKRPRTIFVNSMSDLFHPSVPDGLIMQVWRVMANTPRHTYQILTKRPDRMRDWTRRWADVEGDTVDAHLAHGPHALRAKHSSGRAHLFAAMLETMGTPPTGAAYPFYDWAEGMRWLPPALPNVWLGTSIEDQQRADERIPFLTQSLAAKRFLSYEPALGPVDHIFEGVDWIIAGGESGPGARPMHPDWARRMRDQCARAGIPFFFKQWGDFSPVEVSSSAYLTPEPRHEGEQIAGPCGRLTQFPHAPTVTVLRRVGKRTAGDLLDGQRHQEFPG